MKKSFFDGVDWSSSDDRSRVAARLARKPATYFLAPEVSELVAVIDRLALENERWRDAAMGDQLSLF